MRRNLARKKVSEKLQYTQKLTLGPTTESECNYGVRQEALLLGKLLPEFTVGGKFEWVAWKQREGALLGLGRVLLQRRTEGDAGDGQEAHRRGDQSGTVQVGFCDLG